MLPRARARREENRGRVLALFPVLAERAKQAAGTLSGGEQQMLAIGRCLMGAPELIMFDEPSHGLAPAVAHQLLGTIRDLNRDGLTCLLVEQNVALSLRLASRAYVLENGCLTRLRIPLKQSVRCVGRSYCANPGRTCVRPEYTATL
jgi:branched-chain amino acid transport system ATP-binding protein